jgi:putative lipoprotein
MWRLALVLALAVAALNAESSAGDERAVVRGQASYRERIALLPGAVFEATLEDVSRADAPAAVLGAVRLEDVNRVPIRFEISFDPRQVDERHAYAVRARIHAGGRLAFTTDRAYPVLTRGHGDEVELLLVRARTNPTATGERKR